MNLVETRDGAVRAALPPDRDMAGWHQAVSAEIAHHLSAAHAAILARPERTPEGWAWVADGREVRRFADLGADDRAALMAAAGAILSDVRRLAESGAAPAVRAAWPALREVPDPAYMFAVDGRPVLAAWGHTGSGLLARHDDGRSWQPPPRTPWGAYAALLAALAVLGLLAGLFIPAVARQFVAAPLQCTIAPDQLGAFRDQQRETTRGDELRTLLATLTDEMGRQQLQCPLPQAPPPPPRAETPPPPPPPPQAALPEDRWERHDLSILEGCWNLVTDLKMTETPSGRIHSVRSWQQCFNRNGTGTQTVVRDDGLRCTGPLRAEFQGDRLDVSEPQNCTGPGINVVRSTRVCTRVNDDEADCAGRDSEGPNSGTQYRGRFHR